MSRPLYQPTDYRFSRLDGISDGSVESFKATHVLTEH
jgi:hypothetical protein